MATITQQQHEQHQVNRLHRWTRAEYYRMSEAGLFEGQHVELIEGQVVDSELMTPPHCVSVCLAAKALAAAFAGNWHTRTQAPFHVGSESVPEPDVAVVPGQIRDYSADHPSRAAILVEVAESFLDYDRTVKQRLYARGSVPEYWIVNLIDRQLLVYRDPAPNSATPGEFHYKSCQTLADTDRVTPVTAGRPEILVRDLLP